MRTPPFGALGILWEMSRGYRLRPWRSPYIRWRVETYSGMHAERVTFAGLCRFAWRRRKDLRRYLGWAARMKKGAGRDGAFGPCTGR